MAGLWSRWAAAAHLRTVLSLVHATCLTLVVLQSASGNAAKAGLKSGDTVIYTSSFFGDELWPSAQLGFTRSALANAPSPITIVYVSLLHQTQLYLAVFEILGAFTCIDL